MSLIIRRMDILDNGSEHYEIMSGRERIGMIYCLGSQVGGDQVWRWSFVFMRGGGNVAPSLSRAKAAARAVWDEWLRQAALAEAAPSDESPAPPAAAADDIDHVLAEFDGDARAAIGALLHDLGALAADAQAVVSKGYVRGIDFTSAHAKRRLRPR